MKLSRKTISWIAAAAAFISVLGGCTLLSPLRRREEHIQSWVLRKAPLGSSVAEVKAVISSEGWKLDFEWQGTNSAASPKDYPYVRGGRVICAYLGHYQGIPWRADVDAFWGFDEQGKLIDFHVRKNYDAL